jgi:splicing factor 3A subunit 3
MDSVIEVQRQTHEEIERFERGLYDLLSRNHVSQEAKLQTEHKASQILERMSSRIVALNSSYEDQQTRSTEIELISAPAQQNDLSEFYSRLVKIQEHHSKYPDSVPGGYFDLELAALLDEPEPDDEEEGEDRECLLPSPSRLVVQLLQLYLCYSLEKRPTENIWTCMPITRPITISKISANDLAISNILTCSLLLNQALFTKT